MPSPNTIDVVTVVVVLMLLAIAMSLPEPAAIVPRFMFVAPVHGREILCRRMPRWLRQMGNFPTSIANDVEWLFGSDRGMRRGKEPKAREIRAIAGPLKVVTYWYLLTLVSRSRRGSRMKGVHGCDQDTKNH